MHLRLALVALVTTSGFALVFATPVAAHVDLVSTSPSAGELVGGPVTEVLLEVSDAVTPVDAGIGISGPDGTITLASIDQPSPSVVRLTPAAPLVEGLHEARWRVLGEDGHTLDFRTTFTVGTPSAPVASGAEMPTSTSTSTADAASSSSVVLPALLVGGASAVGVAVLALRKRR